MYQSSVISDTANLLPKQICLGSLRSLLVILDGTQCLAQAVVRKWRKAT